MFSRFPLLCFHVNMEPGDCYLWSHSGIPPPASSSLPASTACAPHPPAASHAPASNTATTGAAAAATATSLGGKTVEKMDVTSSGAGVRPMSPHKAVKKRRRGEGGDEDPADTTTTTTTSAPATNTCIAVAPNTKSPASSASTDGKILVRNVPFEASRNELQQIFSAFPGLRSVRLPRKLKEGSASAASHRGFAFIEYESRSQAETAMQSLCASTHLYGRRLVLEWAKKNDGVYSN